MSLTSKIPKLATELEQILSNDWDPTFTLQKMSACATDDAEGYCSALEEELEVKQERMALFLRESTLSAEICTRLQARVEADKQIIEGLRAAAEENERHFVTATELLVEHVEREEALDNLAKNLERENLREAAESRRLAAQLKRTQRDLAELRSYVAGELAGLKRGALRSCDCDADADTVSIGSE